APPARGEAGTTRNTCESDSRASICRASSVSNSTIIAADPRHRSADDRVMAPARIALTMVLPVLASRVEFAELAFEQGPNLVAQQLLGPRRPAASLTRAESSDGGRILARAPERRDLGEQLREALVELVMLCGGLGRGGGIGRDRGLI